MSDYKSQIESDVANNKILLFIKGEKDMPVCGFSNAVVQIFKKLDVPFETRNVLQDMDYLQTLREFSNWPTTPQVYIDGKFVGGCDIAMEMFERGELEPLVKAALQ